MSLRWSRMTWAVALPCALAIAGCGGGSVPADGGAGAAGPAPTAADDNAAAVVAADAAAGGELFAASCAACHGPQGEGVSGLGKDMTASEFIAAQSDAELLAFIKVGRGTDDPLNTTGVAMPPKGGNPAITDAQLADIVAFIRSIQQ